MKNSPLSLLVVDDNRFSSAMIKRALKDSPYQDIRYTSSASETLQAIKRQPADILIADWLMPEMDGLELTQKVREIDNATQHASYIILITAKDGQRALNQAFDQEIDDFINKDHMNEQLLPRILAAERASTKLNHLITENQKLKTTIEHFNNNSTTDKLTGLGNKRYALQKIKETVKYCEQRSGVIQLLLIEIYPWQEIKKQYPAGILRLIAKAVGKQLLDLSRPLDTLCRINDNQFVLIMHQQNIDACYDRSFLRFHEQLHHSTIKTPIGHISVSLAISNYLAEIEKFTMTSAELLISNAIASISQAKQAGSMTTEILQSRAPSTNHEKIEKKA